MLTYFDCASERASRPYSTISRQRIDEIDVEVEAGGELDDESDGLVYRLDDGFRAQVLRPENT